MIYITGDTHGDMNRIVRFCERMETSQEDIMIILGDVGLNYYEDSRDRRNKEKVANLPITLFCIHVVGFVAIDSAPFGDYYSKSDFFWLNQLEWKCKLFPDSVLRKSMAKMCGVTQGARERMESMLADYSKKELCHLMYIGEAAFIPENKSINLPCSAILILGEKDQVGNAIY